MCILGDNALLGVGYLNTSGLGLEMTLIRFTDYSLQQLKILENMQFVSSNRENATDQAL